MKKIVLFYKRLVEPGGAERLLINEYLSFKKLGYDVDIVSFDIKDEALFGEAIDPNDKVILGQQWYTAMRNYIRYIKRNKNAIYLCASGFIEMYLANLFVSYKYSLHIHHPSFMSFNETDKYSIFQIKHFESMLKSNFGASRFKKIYQEMSLIEKIYINARAFFSILSIKKSEHNFVLSNYAKNEKNILFGIDSNVLCGALNESTFDYEPKKDFSEYSCYKHKLLSIARLDENKRLDELLAAFSDFIKIEPESILLIGGRGPELENLQKQTQDLGIEKNVDFLGFIPEEELFDWYSMADLFVSIDWADYRITMYEALVMNTKVVLSDETDADPFLCDSKYLYTTKPDKLSTLPTLSLALKEKPTISKSELKKYLKKYTWLNYCKEISRILDKSNA
ncbi:glycosyltransferase [Vibrio coralliilyticus]|uniref:glycosyltransferase n=1 Tax=Vibrio TaxID=662 RepID=UPI00050598AC|nr:glycosyltransferase [Vibrio sp. B183]KFI09641.1 hypothetical protein IX95_23055 [Vibrio sp. B183]NOI19539.1 glycosyltransferase [Vibrio coralliilyticus]